MKLHAITTIAVLSGIITTTSADAGKFNLGDAIRTVQQVNHVVKGPQYGGGNPGYVTPLPHPYPQPPVCKPPVCPPPVCPPIVKPCPPPVIKPCPPPVIKPCPPPVYPPVCPKPPVCPPPVCPQPPINVCPHPPINVCPQPPVQCYTMKLINSAGANVFFSLDGQDYQQLANGDAELVKSHGNQPHLIKYHNGTQVVEYELDPTAVYGFEWQGQTLTLLQIQG